MSPDPNVFRALPHASWADCRDAETLFQPGAHCQDSFTAEDRHKRIPRELMPEIHRALTPRAADCDDWVFVLFNNGTVCALPRLPEETDEPALFRQEVERAQAFRFAGEGARYRIPTHRFPADRRLAQAKEFLTIAQTYWDRFASDPATTARHVVAAELAVRLIGEIGYPQPGLEESNANVFQLWRQFEDPSHVFALSRVESMPKNVATITDASIGCPPTTIQGLGALAKSARDSFREDLMIPIVWAVFDS